MIFWLVLKKLEISHNRVSYNNILKDFGLFQVEDFFEDQAYFFGMVKYLSFP